MTDIFEDIFEDIFDSNSPIILTQLFFSDAIINSKEQF